MNFKILQILLFAVACCVYSQANPVSNSTIPTQAPSAGDDTWADSTQSQSSDLPTYPPDSSSSPSVVYDYFTTYAPSPPDSSSVSDSYTTYPPPPSSYPYVSGSNPSSDYYSSPSYTTYPPSPSSYSYVSDPYPSSNYYSSPSYTTYPPPPSSYPYVSGSYPSSSYYSSPSYSSYPSTTNSSQGPTFSSDCSPTGVTLGGSNGTIKYAAEGNYPNYNNCKWYISVPDGKAVIVSFSRLEIENHSSCNYDWVKIRGDKWCRTFEPDAVLYKPPDGRILVEFHSDYSVTRGGFTLDYVIY